MPGVDEHDVDAVLAQAVAQVVVLAALRVERSEQDHGGRVMPRECSTRVTPR